MAVTDIALFGALKTRMSWLNRRQSMLAENVANANTPGFQARDLRPLSAEGLPARPGERTALTAARTDRAHLTLATGSDGRARAKAARSYEVVPGGNSVALEEEMMKVAETQMEYQMATSLYSRGLGILRTALGRRA